MNYSPADYECNRQRHALKLSQLLCIFGVCQQVRATLAILFDRQYYYLHFTRIQKNV